MKIISYFILSNSFYSLSTKFKPIFIEKVLKIVKKKKEKKTMESPFCLIVQRRQIFIKEKRFFFQILRID